jgi:lipopolysaccharide export system protein LptA
MKRASLLAIVLTVVATGGAALAQNAGKSNLFSRAQGPLGISADTVGYMPDNCQSTWKGRVEATQDQTRMRADQLTTFSHRTGASKQCAGDFDRMEATGNVFYVTPQVKARGDKAVYVVADSAVTITGKVIVTSDQGVSETNKLVLNVNTNEATMGDASPGQRVRAVIYPNQKASAAPKAPAAK